MTAEVEELKEILIPNVERCMCPICGAKPQLDTSSLKSGGKCLPRDVLAVKVRCSNKECLGGSFHYDPENWIKRYESIRERWMDPQNSDEALSLIAKWGGKKQIQRNVYGKN